MELKKIKTQYAGKCTDCGRELRVGWDIFFDPATKHTYCTVCAKKLVGIADSPVTLTEEELMLLPPETQERLRKAGVVKPKSIEEQILGIQEQMSLFLQTQTDLLDMLATGFKALETLIQAEKRQKKPK